MSHDNGTIPEHFAPPLRQLLNQCNDEQKQAILHQDGPLMVVAGPGSGKTRVLTGRVAALVANGVAPWRILAVTFTNKAAAEMRTRLTQLVGEDTVRGMWVATFHSACLRILRMYSQQAGLRSNFTILDVADARQVLSSVMKDSGELDGLETEEVKEAVAEAGRIISNAKNDGKTPDDISHGFTSWVAPVFAAYNQRLQDMGAVDFDDLLDRTHRLLENNADVRTEVQGKFRYILVDEYQDTNPIQERIVKLIAAHGNVCVVGDPDQSIYAFRGATPGVLESFPDTWPDAVVVQLGQNYRSTSTIVNASKSLISGNEAQWRADLTTDGEQGEPIWVNQAPTSYDEARWIGEQIQKRGQPWSQHAVLVRVSALTSEIESELARRRVPYKVIAGMNFYERKEVKAAIAWMKIGVNPYDDVAFARACTTPRRGIGEKAVQDISAAMRSNNCTVREAVDMVNVSGRAAKGLESFLHLQQEVYEQAQEGPLQALEYILDQCGIRQFAQEQKDKDGVDRIKNLDALMERVYNSTQLPESTDLHGTPLADLDGLAQTQAFLSSVSLASETVSDSEDFVHLMTIHAAKGREFDHVYVPGFEENIIPHQRSLRGSAVEEAEERRLAYVAVSRARKSVAITHCAERTQYGKRSEARPSRYLKDIPGQQTLYDGVESDNVYHISQAKSARKPTYRPGARKLGVVPASAQGSRNKAAPDSKGPRVKADQIHVGQVLNHTIFGHGKVTSVTGNVIEMLFTDGKRRSLDVTMAPLTNVEPK